MFGLLLLLGVPYIFAFCMSFDIKERIAWLRRMPLHWKLLLGGQFLFTCFAISARQAMVEKRRQELLEEEKQSQGH